MKKQLIFNEEEITVFKVTYPDVRGIEFLIGDGENSFTTSETPRLRYRALKNMLKLYLLDKEAAFESDNRGEEDESDFWANFDTQTEAF